MNRPGREIAGELDITEENRQKGFENMKELYSKRLLQLKKVERSGTSAQDVQKATPK